MQVVRPDAVPPAPQAPAGGAVRPDPSDPPCPVCRRSNEADRLLCSGCAAELDTGRPHALWSGALDTPSRAGGRPAAGPRYRPALRGLGLLVPVVALVAGSLRLLGIGPFAPPARLEAAVLLAAGYPDAPQLLAVDAVGTTTTVVGVVDRDVAALRLIDGDAATAWIGAPVVDGAGEVIDLVLAEPAWVTGLEVRNGDHSSNDAYERSDRLLSGLLTFDGARTYRVDLLDIGIEAQTLTLPQPELTTRVSIRVEQVFAGTGARGVALSEVAVIGWSAGAADAALARERARTP